MMVPSSVKISKLPGVGFVDPQDVPTPKPAQSASSPPAAFHNRNGGYLIVLGRVMDKKSKHDQKNTCINV